MELPLNFQSNVLFLTYLLDSCCFFCLFLFHFLWRKHASYFKNHTHCYTYMFCILSITFLPTHPTHFIALLFYRCFFFLFFLFFFFFASRWNSQGHSIQSQSYKLLFLWCGWNSAVLCFHAWINLLMWSYVTPYMHRKGSLLTPVKMLYISALSRGFLILPLESNIRFLGS